MRTYINGEVVQEDPVTEMTFPIDYILADLCRHITLLPGDVVLTGTPANSRPMQLGDVVEVEVTGIGRLSNTVAEMPGPDNVVGHQAQHDSEGIAAGRARRRLVGRPRRRESSCRGRRTCGRPVTSS